MILPTTEDIVTEKSNLVALVSRVFNQYCQLAIILQMMMMMIQKCTRLASLLYFFPSLDSGNETQLLELYSNNIQDVINALLKSIIASTLL